MARRSADSLPRPPACVCFFLAVESNGEGGGHRKERRTAVARERKHGSNIEIPPRIVGWECLLTIAVSRFVSAVVLRGGRGGGSCSSGGCGGDSCGKDGTKFVFGSARRAGQQVSALIFDILKIGSVTDIVEHLVLDLIFSREAGAVAGMKDLGWVCLAEPPFCGKQRFRLVRSK